MMPQVWESGLADVVLVHGVNALPRYWTKLCDSLDGCVVCPPLPGRLPMAKCSETEVLELAMKEVSRALYAAARESVVVGHSLGALLIDHVVRSDPNLQERQFSFVAINASDAPLFGVSYIQRIASAILWLVTRLPLPRNRSVLDLVWANNRILKFAVASTFGVRAGADDQVIVADGVRQTSMPASGAYARWVLRNARHFLTEGTWAEGRLALVSGSEDSVFRAASCARLAARVGCLHVEAVGVGHHAPLEAVDLVAALVRELPR